MSGILSDKDVNVAVASNNEAEAGKDIKSMEYHRKVLQSKMEAEKGQKYVSPSDNIMSPCTAKLNALRTKHIGKAKPRSLFAQGVAKKLDPNGAKRDSIF